MIYFYGLDYKKRFFESPLIGHDIQNCDFVNKYSASIHHHRKKTKV